MKRRNFISALGGTYIVSKKENIPDTLPTSDREYWVANLLKISNPILNNLAKNTLKSNFTIELSPQWDNRNKDVAYLEAFSRLLVGISPWLSLPKDSSEEGKAREETTRKVLLSIKNAVDPASGDFMLWEGEGQSLVDAAFFAQALLKAKNTLWTPLSSQTKSQIISVLKLQRKVSPGYITGYYLRP